MNNSDYDSSINMLLFEDDMQKIKAYARIMISNKGKRLEADIDEVVNEVFLKMVDKQIEYSFIKIKSMILDVVLNFTPFIAPSFNESYPDRKLFIMNGETKKCSCCYEVLPVSSFNVHRKYPSGIVSYKSSCKKCCQEKSKLSLQKRMTDPNYRKIWNEKNRIRQQKRARVINSNPRLKKR